MVNEEFKLREVNSSKKFYTGSEWESIRGGSFKVLGQIDLPSREHKGYPEYDFFLVEFPTGFRKQVRGASIRAGNVANPYHPTVHNVGFLGEGEYKCCIDNKITKEYKLWSGVIQRGYDPVEHKRHPTYKDCSVDPRWHNFQNFCEDIQYLENYDKWKENTEPLAWQLDKDIKVKGNRVYSKDTCMFVTMSENSREALERTKCNLTGKLYKATRSSDGYTEEFDNQTAFGIKYGISQGKMSSYTNVNKYLGRECDGWIFEIIGKSKERSCT